MGLLFTFSIDDGHPSDLKMADLLDKYDLRGTFYVPIRNREGYAVLSPEQLAELGRRFEIGSHTYDHCYLNEVDIWEAYFQIAEGKKELESMIGTAVTGFCYPGGKYTQRDIDLVKACGFKYARTTMNLRFDVGHNPYEMPTTVQFYPHDRSVYVRNFAAGHWMDRQGALRLAMMNDDWMQRLFAMFDYACEHGEVFHVWAHSREIDKLGAWDKLDDFFRHVASAVAPENRVTNAQASSLVTA
jgi:hypothetical protein